MKRLLSILLFLPWLIQGQVSVPPPISIGATASSNGIAGLLPAPVAGDQVKFYRGDATYQLISGGGDLLRSNLLGEFSSVADKAAVASNVWLTSNFDNFGRIAAMLGGVKFDGVTGSQRAATTWGDWNIGTGEYSLSVFMRVPTAALSTIQQFLTVGTSSSSQTARGIRAYFSATSGNLVFMQYGATVDVDSRTATVSSFISTYGGKCVLLTFTRNSAGTLTIYVNTASVAYTEGSSGGSAPASLAESVVGNNILIGGASGSTFGDRIIRVIPFNVALSASDVATLYNDGVLADYRWVNVHGGNAIMNVERNSTFSATGTDWSGDGTSTITTNGVVTFTGFDQYVGLTNSYIAQITPGVLHKVTFDVSAGTFSGNSVQVYLANTPNASSFYGSSLATITANGSYNAEFTPPVGVTALSMLSVGGASTFTIDNVRLTRVLLTNGNFATSSSATNFGIWSEGAASGGSVNVDTVVYRSGTQSCRIDYVTGGTSHIIQDPTLVIGKRYRMSAWLRQNSGVTKTQFAIYGPASGTASQIVTSDNNGAVTIPTDTWVRVEYDFVAQRTAFGFPGYSSLPGNGFSLWFADVELIELGAMDAWGPSGLDELATHWRTDNPSSGRDATLFGIPQRPDGTYQGIVIGYGREAAARGDLNRVSRERRALSNGGIYLLGNANQRITSSPSTTQTIGTNAFWIQVALNVPTSNPASTQYPVMISSSTSGGAANGLYMSINTSGHLVFLIYGASTSDFRYVQALNVVSMFGGRVITVAVCRSLSGNVSVWINGNRAQTTESTNGTPPAWTSSITSTYYTAGLTPFAGELFMWRVGRGTLTDSLVRELYTSGPRSTTGGTSPIGMGGSFSGSLDGVVIDLDISVGAGAQYPDRSGNGYHALSYNRDETHKLPKRTFQYRAQSSLAAYQQLGGQVVIPTNAMIRAIVANVSGGTPTINIGNATSTTNIVGSQTLATGMNWISESNFVSRFSSTGNLWVNSTTTNAINWTFELSLAE